MWNAWAWGWESKLKQGSIVLCLVELDQFSVGLVKDCVKFSHCYTVVRTWTDVVIRECICINVLVDTQPDIFKKKIRQ